MRPDPYTFIISEFGDAETAAKAIGCHRATVFRWKQHPINIRWLKRIYKASKYNLTLQLLRPDLYKPDEPSSEH
jgi:hypothetical protein